MRPQLFAADHVDTASDELSAPVSFNEAAAIRCGSPVAHVARAIAVRVLQ